MRIARTLADLRASVTSLRASHGSIALVPTMGALHDGHRALVRAAVTSGAATVTSIFVNPLQFAASEDLSRYPRDEAGDLAILEASGCALVWMPDVLTMYPSGDATTITVTGPAENWEGAARPGHFRGVATVCAKLFGQVRPDRAYFGEKDWQQIRVISRMVDDLLLPLSIVTVATVREPDGVAMSSRNRFLSTAERARAPLLHEMLTDTARTVADGRPADGPLAAARARLTDAGFGVDYFALVDGATLVEIPARTSDARLIAVARLGSVRLLDNIAAGEARSEPPDLTPARKEARNMIVTEIKDGWRKLILNRPEKLNAVNSAMLTDLLLAIGAAEDDHATRALLLTGNGRGFCAGQELGPEITPGPDGPPDLEALANTYHHEVVRRLRASRLPVVCAVNGVAAGAGASFALACDIVLAAKSARFVQSFVKIGLVPDSGASFFLTHSVGEARARALAMLGDAVDAVTAGSWGMIWKAVDDADLMAEAEALTASLTRAPTSTLSRMKRLFMAAGTNSLREQLDLEAVSQGESGRTADFAEGVRAFQEKRPPVFKGE